MACPPTLAQTVSLAEAIKPSRAGCAPPKATKKGRQVKSKRSDDDERDKVVYVSPPPKTAAETRAWNRMSSRMEGFHSYFRSAFQEIYTMADKIDPSTLASFLAEAASLEQHLQMHHAIEEQHIFPVLRQRMPEFADEHLEEHKAIHDGLDRYSSYIRRARQSPSTAYNPDDLRRIMASFGPVLFYHLDAEVESLRADNLRKYYTLDEVNRLPM